MSGDPTTDARPMAVMLAVILIAGVTAATAMTTRREAVLTELQWIGVGFTCLVAPAITSWLTWRRLTRYLPFVPGPAKRILFTAAGTFIMLGVYAFMSALSAVKR